MLENISVSLYRQILKSAKKQHNWKPKSINYVLSKEDNRQKFLHCVWLDSITKRKIYNVCNYNEGDSYIHNYLCFIKFLIRNNDKNLHRIEWLFWLLRVQKTTLTLKYKNKCFTR